MYRFSILKNALQIIHCLVSNLHSFGTTNLQIPGLSDIFLRVSCLRSLPGKQNPVIEPLSLEMCLVSTAGSLCHATARPSQLCDVHTGMHTISHQWESYALATGVPKRRPHRWRSRWPKRQRLQRSSLLPPAMAFPVATGSTY